MRDDEDKVSAAIAEQAGERFVANDAGPLAAQESAALTAWLKSSPVHVEEFLGVSVIARDLRELKQDPEYSVDAVLEGARAEDERVQPLWPRVNAPFRGMPPRRWQTAAVTLAGFAAVVIGLLVWWNPEHTSQTPAESAATALHFRTGHGEQLTQRLADGSVLHLNTDSALTIQYGSSERLVTLSSGEASFEVVHEPRRAFRVLAGSAQIVAVGTRFDVRLEQEATVVTVAEGRVAVGPPPIDSQPTRFVELSAGRQLRLIAGQWPPTVVDVDSERAAAWLHRQISFEHEPLERVAAEYNRYAPKPIQIVTPALRSLLISGVFATDDPEEFIAFLRKLKGVRVEVTPTQIRVSGD